MKILCRNYKCKWIRFLDVPINFQMRKNYYIPFENDLCRGECRKEDILINMIDETIGQTRKKVAYCCETEYDND